MEFNSLSGKPLDKIDKHPKTKTLKIKDTVVEFTPTFEQNDLVSVIPKFSKYSSNLSAISNLTLVVDYCKVADLGDMIIEVLYLKKNNELICNPYMVEHFKLKT